MSNTESLLSKAGIKVTASRILVLKAIAQADHPLSMMEIEKELESVDKSQISRALNLFMENDLLHKIDDGLGTSHYELCHSHSHDGEDSDVHVHFYCEKCRKLLCLEDQAIPQVSVPGGFQAHHYTYIIQGICADCRS